LSLDESLVGAFEPVSEKVTYRLAQRPASYVVLKYIRPVVKRKNDGQLITLPAPDGLWPGSMVDVSVVAGIVVDKFAYHLPLYRQHQRMGMNGITVARSSLTQWVAKASALLKPIYLALLRHILLSKTLAMDETPIKAGRSGKGKMNAAWYWPIYGEDDEIAFTFSRTRARSHIEQTLGDFKGTLLSDGAAAYARFAADRDEVVHAQCWAHTRRHFDRAQLDEPSGAAEALALIGELYAVERTIRDKAMDAVATQSYRMEQALPAVDRFFAWLDEQRHRMDLLPSQPFAKALAYAAEREGALRVYLFDPTVAIDTNHLERALRPIPMGRKNWLFCWSEVGAEHVGIIQSLLCTCRMHGINPYTYLVDVLQRIAIHPDSDVEQLTPRVWKSMFADEPLRSDLSLITTTESLLQDVSV
jgi:transposase